MTLRNAVCRTSTVWIAVAALLLSPARTWAARLATASLSADNFLQDSQDAQDKEQERRDREQEARDREQEKRDREQEAHDRAQEKADRLEELYEDGREALDEDRYDKAEAKFDQLAQLKGPQTDAALYWKRSEEHTSELQSRLHLVCRLLLEKKTYQAGLRHDAVQPDIE